MSNYKWDVVGYIYFLRYLGDMYESIPSGSIKIGHSINPEKRMVNFSHLKPRELLGVKVGTRIDEGHIHDQFSHLNISREWFKPEPELLAYIHRNTTRIDIGNVRTNWLCDIATVQLPLFNKE